MGIKYVFNPTTGNLDATSVETPAGSDTQVQFNDGGSFGGDSGLVFNKTTNKLTAGGDVELNDGGSFTTTLQVVTPTAARTISFPNATGTVGLVAGSSGQLVYNNAGAYAGVPSSVIGTTGNITLSLNGATGVAPVAVTGTWFVGTTPQVLIQPSNVGTAGAWSASGTGIGVNAVTGFGGNLLDLQVNGTSRFGVDTTGYVKIAPTQGSTGVGYWPILYRRSDGVIDSDSGITISNNEDNLSVNGLVLNSSQVRGSGTALAFIVQSANQHVRLSNTNLQFGAPSGGPIVFGPASSQSALSSEWARIDSSGNVGIGTNAPTTLLDVNANTVRVRTARTPASATATGAAGEICWDADYIYICTATNTWKRAAIATW